MIAMTDTTLAYAGWTGLLVLSVLGTAFFCGMETGIYVLNKIRLDLAAESGRASARLLRKLLSRPNNLLSVLLIGTNLASYFATFAVSSIFIRAGYEHSAEWMTLLVATPILFILAESVPKNVFARLAEKLLYRLTWPLAASSAIANATGVAPLVRGFSAMLIALAGSRGQMAKHSQPLMATLVAEGHASGALTHFQSIMADRAMRIGEINLADVMVPMAGVVKADRSATSEQLMVIISRERYSRIPLLDENGQVTSILDTFDALAGAGEFDPQKLARPAIIFAESISVTDALYRLQKAKEVIAIVADPAGKHVGIVTIKDLVEEIVGELHQW